MHPPRLTLVKPLARPAPEWGEAKGLEAVLSKWEEQPLFRSVVADALVPGQEAAFADVPAELAAPVVEALRARGVERLYRHQAEVFGLARAGRDAVVATPTASGKSLCYHLPILDRLARERQARALYLFPTKALSRDQELAVRDLMSGAGLETGAITYDGDTPGDARRAARERSGVLITNPDMLHSGILPHHAAWARFFAALRFVVIDELHSYRGVFGSHLANVIRRLLRIAKFHGAEPVFLLASATIGNPREHASRLVGRDVALVERSGAPSGPRRVLVYNPPVVNAELGVRASYTKSSVRLASDLVRANVPAIVFGQSRNQVEVMLKYLRDRVERDGGDPAAIQGYRGGYLPETRRRIEVGLREGEVRCVVATNALELGIDIGGLDAAICAGYPGSIAGLWQRFGRAGRRRGLSLAVLVTSSAPLDQYLARRPGDLLGAPIEHARLDADNIEILVRHLECASFELPFQSNEPFGDVPAHETQDALAFLSEKGVLQPVSGPAGLPVYHWSADTYPANDVSLRSAGWHNVVVIDVERTESIAEMDFRSAHTMLHERAIYQQEGEQYQVERLDLENHKAYVRKVAPDYYTTALTHGRVNVLYEDANAWMSWGGASGLRTARGEVNVVERVVGYKKIKFHTHENVGYGDVVLPEMQLPTTAWWVAFPEEIVRLAGVERPVFLDALRGIAGAMHTVASLGLMIDPRDLGWTLSEDPAIYLYDHVAGGIGLAPRLYEDRESVLRRAFELIAGCGCDDGCPACVGPVVESARKRVALDVLRLLGIGAVV